MDYMQLLTFMYSYIIKVVSLLALTFTLLLIIQLIFYKIFNINLYKILNKKLFTSQL